MTYTEMLKHYNEHSAADIYAVGFIRHEKLYTMYMDHLPDEILYNDHASSKVKSRAGAKKIRVRISAAFKDRAIASGEAILEGPATLMDYQDKYTNGHHYEHFMTETYAHETWTWDNVPFWVKGDCEIEGKQVQCKFDSAELTNEVTIHNMLELFGLVG